MGRASNIVCQVENPWLDLPPSRPYVLPMDGPQVDAYNEKHQAKYRFDLDLIPAPFMGNPEARLVLLARNPGISPGDHEAHRDPDFTSTLRANIQGRPEAQAAVGLLNRFRDLPTGIYWRPLFRWLLERVRSSDDLASRVLIVEFQPYRSIEYRRVTLPSQLYGFHLVRNAVGNGATIVFLGPAEWRIAVPELGSYPKVVPLRNTRRPYLSPGNCGHEEFQQVLAAVGCGP
jgi:hypothetical protein